MRELSNNERFHNVLHVFDANGKREIAYEKPLNIFSPRFLQQYWYTYLLCIAKKYEMKCCEKILRVKRGEISLRKEHYKVCGMVLGP